MLSLFPARAQMVNANGRARMFDARTVDAPSKAGAVRVVAVNTRARLLIIECDGVLVDIHKEIHLAAFNAAFRELGLDCANWTPAIYTDLIRMGDGTVRGMLEAYFGMVGWPMFLATSDRPQWCDKVEALKKEAVPKLIAEEKVKLRDGAEQFLRGILADGSVKVAVVAATASDPEDAVAECALAALGAELREGILVFGSAASAAPPAPESLEAQLATFIQQQKTDAASRVQEVWEKSSEGGALPVNMDASLLGVTSQRSTCSADLLSTVAALAGVSKQHTVFMTCSGALVHTAAAAEIKAVVIKNSLLSRGAEFPGCAGSFDGFGAGGGATAARLISLMS